jgi:4-diphosphocytidyl-2-C-methyl-D-erythritol kinase
MTVHAYPEDPARWPAPAKLNLFLQVTGRRPDGYHLLQTVFQLLDWGDEVAITPRSDGLIRRVEGPAGVPPEADLSVRAARALQDATGCRRGVDLRVDKRIPLGGGFGGGSSDAATVLVVLNDLWRTGLKIHELSAIGSHLGADVPVFVEGRSAWAEGIGERLQPLDLPRRWYLIVDSGISVPTRDLFQAPELTRDSPSATIADFVSGKARGNAFEPVLRRRAPAVAQALDELGKHGAAQLTGTGGGMFVAFDDPGRAEAARQALPSGWRAWVAAGTNESALHRQRRERNA